MIEDLIRQLKALDLMTTELEGEDWCIAADRAMAQAAVADVLLVAGKGHEHSQEIAGVFHPFSDVQQIAQAMEGRTWA